MKHQKFSFQELTIVPVKEIYWDWEDGLSIHEIAADYPHLSAKQIEAVIAQERRPIRRAQRTGAAVLECVAPRLRSLAGRMDELMGRWA